MALEIVDELRREFAIDETRIYVAGQSMGGAGVWNMIAGRPGLLRGGGALLRKVTRPMTALGRLTLHCGAFTAKRTRLFQCPCRESGLQQDGKQGDIRSTRNTLAWTTMFGNGLSLSRSWCNGCLRSVLLGKCRKGGGPSTASRIGRDSPLRMTVLW